MSKIVHLIDRSRVVAREDCPRLRFLNFDYDNDGLDTDQASLPLLSGIAIHAAHARLLAGESLEGVVESTVSDYVAEIETRGLAGLTVTKDIIKEQASLLEGMLRVWAVIRMPAILEEYEVISIEKPFDWEIAPGLVLRMRFDAVLRRKADGLLFILDYKTMGYASEFFMEKQEHDKQTCLYIQALKETQPAEQVGGIMYEGLVKGKFAKDTNTKSPFFGQKLLNSPYTVAYALKSDMGALYQTAWTARKGWEKVKTYEEMPMKEWVENYLLPGGDNIISTNELFVVVPPIEPPDYELQREKRQTANEELTYLDQLTRYRELLKNGSLHSEDFLNMFAPLRTGRCFKYGAEYGCKFRSICFNQGAQPLAEGSGFKKRVPHHDTDIEMIAS